MIMVGDFMSKILTLDNVIFKKTEPVLLALSGGRDSMCLLDLLIKNNYNVIVAHVNHKKRLESEVEEQYIKNYCNKLNIPCEIAHYKAPKEDNFQALAHDFRYDFFYSVAKKYKAKYILTAHQTNDLAETILLRLISGSNLYGYGGISKLVNFKDIYIYRPLLSFSRCDIDNYVKENNIYYFEDETNSHNDYLRNRIRHNILPLFIKENPNFLQGMLNYSTILKESFSYIRKNTILYLNNKLEFNISSFNNLDIAIKKDVLSYILENYNIKGSLKLIDDLLNIINNNKPQLDYNLKNNYIFCKRYDKCYIKLKEAIVKNKIILNLNEEKNFLNYSFYLTKNISNPNAKYLKLWYNDEDLPLTIRNRENGDYLSFKYGKKKIKDYFIDKKIPKEKRDIYPIILNNKGEIIAIMDLINLSKGNDYIYLVCEVKDAK